MAIDKTSVSIYAFSVGKRITAIPNRARCFKLPRTPTELSTSAVTQALMFPVMISVNNKDMYSQNDKLSSMFVYSISINFIEYLLIKIEGSKRHPL